MAQLFGLSQEQVVGIRPLFPKKRGVKRVDDKRHPLRDPEGSAQVDAPAADGPHTTLYNRCRCWSDKGIFDLIFSELSASDPSKSSDAIGPPDSAEPCDVPEPEVLMIDATDLKAHPTASSFNKGDLNPI